MFGQGADAQGRNVQLEQIGIARDVELCGQAGMQHSEQTHGSTVTLHARGLTGMQRRMCTRNEAETPRCAGQCQ